MEKYFELVYTAAPTHRFWFEKSIHCNMNYYKMFQNVNISLFKYDIRQ